MLVDEQPFGAGVFLHALINQRHQRLVLSIQGVLIQQGLGMQPGRIVDKKLEAGQANARITKLTKADQS